MTEKVTGQAGNANRSAGTAPERILQPQVKDLGEFSVRRLLPAAKCKMVGPWIFFDHFGPATFPVGKGVNVRPHPHIGIATVTYLFEGEILHRDSLGSLQAIRPGDINLMVAGRGIVHSERERPEVTAVEHPLHGLQLWLALPDADEACEPTFQHYPGESIPVRSVKGVPVRVMMGSAYGVSSPVRTFAEALCLVADLQMGQSLILPDARELGLYVVSGGLKTPDLDIAAHSMSVFAKQAPIEVTAVSPTRLVLIGGAPVGERLIEWNFVSSRREIIEKAKRDWVEGRFPKVPGDEVEFIPLP